jgi:hypothetical protein
MWSDLIFKTIPLGCIKKSYKLDIDFKTALIYCCAQCTTGKKDYSIEIIF